MPLWVDERNLPKGEDLESERMEFNSCITYSASASVFSRPEADAHETGYDLRGEFRQQFDEEVRQTLAEEIDVHELFDDGVSTETANSEADATIQGQQSGDKVVGNVLHFKGKNRSAAGDAGSNLDRQYRQY